MEYYGLYRRNDYDYEKSLESILQRCESVCNDMITYIVGRPDIGVRQNQINLLRDCVQICISTSIFLSAKSQFINENVVLCAKICKTCANECMKYSDQMSQACASECMYCANECMNYINMI